MKDMEMIIKVFKAFCDENRLKILEMLHSSEKCGCVLLEDLQISQSTLSHHMRILCDSEIVHSRKEGKWTYYTIDKSGCERAMELIAYLINSPPETEEHPCCLY